MNCTDLDHHVSYHQGYEWWVLLSTNYGLLYECLGKNQFCWLRFIFIFLKCGFIMALLFLTTLLTPFLFSKSAWSLQSWAPGGSGIVTPAQGVGEHAWVSERLAAPRCGQERAHGHSPAATVPRSVQERCVSSSACRLFFHWLVFLNHGLSGSRLF